MQQYIPLWINYFQGNIELEFWVRIDIRLQPAIRYRVCQFWNTGENSEKKLLHLPEDYSVVQKIGRDIGTMAYSSFSLE